MTTLTEARRAALKLSESLPEVSTYAAQLAVLSDYLDNQVPLNIENSNLLQRLAVAEGFVREVHKQSGRMVEAMGAASSESCVKALGYCRCSACTVSSSNYIFNSAPREAMRADSNNRRFTVINGLVDLSQGSPICPPMPDGSPCNCPVCAAHA